MRIYNRKTVFSFHAATALSGALQNQNKIF